MNTLLLITIILGVDFAFLLLAVVFWYVIWVRVYGCSIPNRLYDERNYTNFNSKNIRMVVKELLSKLQLFEKEYIVSTCGFESFAYLVFQRQTILFLIITLFISLSFAVAGFIINFSTYQTKAFTVQDVLVDLLFRNNSLNEYTSYFHISCMVLFILLQIRFLTIVKRELKELYFSRFDKLSRKKTFEWLSCRTLHISGIAPYERNVSLLKSKLNYFLSNQNDSGIGSVVEVSFIPDYKNILELEITKEEINDIKKLVNYNVRSFFRSCCFPKTFRSEDETEKALATIEEKINEEIEKPVISSGHAFVTFNSLKTAYICLQAFREDAIKNLRIQIKDMKDNREKAVGDSRFVAFKDEDPHKSDRNNEYKIDSVNILVDQMIEPSDIIWTNIGGDRGINIYRRILCTVILIMILIFMTTPTVIYSTIKSIVNTDDLESLNYPVIDYLKTYFPAFAILFLNQVLLIIIDIMCRFEKHYTYSRLQTSIFKKTYFYFILNMLLIPGFTLSTAHSIFEITFGDKKLSLESINDMISNMYIGNQGFFFSNLIIQNGVFSSIFYLLRLDELFINSYSSFITFYKRHFVNNGKPYHRKEEDVFQFGYFYAQMLTIMSISIVFSSTVPFVNLAAILYFLLRHATDFLSLLMVHRSEMDSNGCLVSSYTNNLG